MMEIESGAACDTRNNPNNNPITTPTRTSKTSLLFGQQRQHQGDVSEGGRLREVAAVQPLSMTAEFKEVMRLKELVEEELSSLFH